jgi:AraC family transcriptional regulator
LRSIGVAIASRANGNLDLFYPSLCVGACGSEGDGNQSHDGERSLHKPLFAAILCHIGVPAGANLAPPYNHGVLGRTLFSQRLGDVAISQTTYEPRMLMEPHAHERPYVSFVIEGRYTEHSREAPRHLHRSMLVFHPAGEVHADCVHDQSMATLNIEYCSGDLPGEFFAAGGVEVESLELRFLAALSASGRGLLDAIAAISAFVRMRAEREEPSEQMVRARKALRDGVRPRTVTALASELGMHRVALHRAFKRAYGESLRGDAARHRLAAAAKLLTVSQESVAGIAVSCGYYDQSHFCREFKRFAGMAPSAYRRAFAVR